MKPFKFSLQALQTLRLRKEREAMEAYARALLERARKAEQLEAMDHALAAGNWEWQQRVAAGCTAADMVHYQLHCRDLALKRALAATSMNAAERQAEAALQAMLLARQEREIVDKFFERQHDAYDRALTRAEQKFLDELAHRRVENPLSSIPNLHSAS